MLCDECKKREATVHMTSVINNEKKEQHLCSVCANKLQQEGKFSPFASFGSDMWDHDFFTNDFFTNMLYPKGFLSEQEQRRCPQCGISYKEFNRTGKFGCDKCYDTFSAELEPLLQRLQGTTEYDGRVPNRGDSLLKIKHEIKGLKQQLTDAIKAEQFEEAAKYRDKIKQLEDSMKNM